MNRGCRYQEGKLCLLETAKSLEPRNPGAVHLIGQFELTKAREQMELKGF